MSRPTLEPHGRFHAQFTGRAVGRRRWQLTERVSYTAPPAAGEPTRYIHAPAGELTDLASVPLRALVFSLLFVPAAVSLFVPGWVLYPAIALIVWTFPSREETAAAAAIHDHLYRNRAARRWADAVFYHALRCSGVGRLWSTAFWLAVRLFGSLAYRNPRLRRLPFFPAFA